MKKVIIIIFAILLVVGCEKDTQKTGPDYSLIKPKLELSKKQEKQFDNITSKYSELRTESFANARSGGKMNREAMITDMKRLFSEQGNELKTILNNKQFDIYDTWLQKQMPGRIGWSPELISQIKDSLALDSIRALMIDAVNEAFIEAYTGAHDNYHGNNEAAKQYWTEFNRNRHLSLKKVLSEKEYALLLELTKDVKFKGEHGK